MHKILVVDDEKGIREIVKRVLTSKNFKVFTSPNGKDALETLREISPDLVILDVNMPLMNGYQVCREIRKDPLYKKLPVIILTVNDGVKDQLKGYESGSDEYMPKPFSPIELVQRINKLLKIKD